DQFEIGKLKCEYIATPGHTPACGCYKIEDNIFVGDTLFMHDFGTARCDFPGGNARDLYKSIKRILSHPENTTLWMCHDYLTQNRKEYEWKSTVGQQRALNPHVKDGINEDEFVRIREDKDSQLSAPKLIVPSIQVNMRAGEMPPAEDNGISYLKIPVKFKERSKT
ncbi:MBL fold metallo-hydrolase, partial [Paracoccaceae bacterium]|nr:MBL fold metallo-hydrolase [Paracoccaceae bacterium]